MQYVQNATSEQTEMFLDYGKIARQPDTTGIWAKYSSATMMCVNLNTLKATNNNVIY